MVQLTLKPENSAAGYGKTVLSALREIPEGLAKAGSGLYQWERRKAADLAEAMGADPETVKAIANFQGEQWTPEQIEQGSDTAVNAVLPESAEAPVKEWTQHEPETPEQEGVAAVSQFLPALATKNPEGLAGGAALLRKFATRVLMPAAAVEKSGDIAGEIAPEYENAVRFVAGAIASPQAWKTGAARSAVHDVTTKPGALAALRRLVLADYGNSPAGMAKAQQALTEMGVEGTLMDIGPNLKQGGQQIFAKPGPGREAIGDKLKGREEAASDRIEALTRENIGPKVDEDLMRDALLQRKREGGQEQEAAHPAQAAPADLEPIVTHIDTLLATEKSPKIRSTLESVRKMLHIDKTDPNQPAVTETASEPILSARQAIGELVFDKTLPPKEAQILKDLYARINEQLDTANPTLRAADKKIEQAAKEEEAFDVGRKDAIKTDVETAIAPEAFARQWDALGDAEKGALRSGLTARVDAMKGLTGNDRAALKKIILGEGKWNHQKIATIIGQEAADNLVKGLKRETKFQETERDVLYNSKTAQTQTVDKDPKLIEIAKEAVDRSAAGGAIAGTTGAVVGGLTAPLKGGLTWLGDKFTAGKRAEIGRLLSSGTPEDVLAAIQTLKDSKGGPTQLLLNALYARREQQKQEGK